MWYEVGTKVYIFSYGKSVVSTPNCEVLHLLPFVSRFFTLSTDVFIYPYSNTSPSNLYSFLIRQ